MVVVVVVAGGVVLVVAEVEEIVVISTNDVVDDETDDVHAASVNTRVTVPTEFAERMNLCLRGSPVPCPVAF